MVDETRYDKIIQQSLKDELRFINAQIPGKQKSLKELLDEELPAIICSDGSRQLIKKKELDLLSKILPSEYWNTLMLPVIIEINPNEEGISVLNKGESESLVLSSILGMPLNIRNKRIILHKAQLAAIRKQLKTTTQYLFSPGNLT